MNRIFRKLKTFLGNPHNVIKYSFISSLKFYFQHMILSKKSLLNPTDKLRFSSCSKITYALKRTALSCSLVQAPLPIRGELNGRSDNDVTCHVALARSLIWCFGELVVTCRQLSTLCHYFTELRIACDVLALVRSSYPRFNNYFLHLLVWYLRQRKYERIVVLCRIRKRKGYDYNDIKR